jgi:urocanate hydratase
MPDAYYNSRFPTRSPKGPGFFVNKCGNWAAEAAARNLINNLDPKVAERRDSRVVYGGRGRAARTWFDAAELLYELSELKRDECMMVESGKYDGKVRMPGSATAVQICNTNLIGSHDTQEHYDFLEKLGLISFGQYTAGSWIYIGTQGILQGTYYTFAEACRKISGTVNLSGKKILTAGCGAMGGAQGLAATLGGGTILIVEPRIEALKKRQGFKQLDIIVTAEKGLDKALRLVDKSARKGEALSVGFVGNAGTIYPELIKKGWMPDIVTEQTPAHDRLKYLPDQMTVEEADVLSRGDEADQARYKELAGDTLSRHINAMLEFQKAGVYVFDYGTGARRWAEEVGVPVVGEDGQYVYKGFVPDLIRAGYFVDGAGPFRFVAYNGQRSLRRLESALMREMREDRHELMQIWLRKARTLTPQGSASRILWLNYQDRARAAEIFYDLITGYGMEEMGAVAIGRDHLDVGGAASLERETEGLVGGAISNWVELAYGQAMRLGADVVSLHGGGGTGMGNAKTWGYTLVITDTQDSIDRADRVLKFDPAQGIHRLHEENVPGAAERIAVINQERWMHFPPYRNRAGLVT